MVYRGGGCKGMYSLENAERFLNAFNRIENFLRKETNSKPGVSFVELVSRAAKFNNVVDKYKDDLREFAQLRNAIVHQTTEQPIAVPIDEVVQSIECIAQYLLSPPKVIPTFQRKVFTMYDDDSVRNAMINMYRKKYSQIPIYTRDGEFVFLLTTYTITMWLGECMDKNILNPGDYLIRDVACYEANCDNYRFVSSQATLFDVLDIFHHTQRKGTRLEAVLITDSGNIQGKLMGIITVWDLPQINEILNL